MVYILLHRKYKKESEQVVTIYEFLSLDKIKLIYNKVVFYIEHNNQLSAWWTIIKERILKF